MDNTDWLTSLENIVPAKYRTLLTLAAIAVPFIGRAYHALQAGHGITGIWKAIVYGTNVPMQKETPPPGTSEKQDVQEKKDETKTI